jgi:hypothetical protein
VISIVNKALIFSCSSLSLAHFLRALMTPWLLPSLLRRPYRLKMMEERRPASFEYM